MTDPRSDSGTANAQRRARWRSYFESTIFGPDSEVETATEAAMRAVARGEGQQAIITAGVEAAKADRLRRQRSGATPPPRHSTPPPRQAQRQQTHMQPPPPTQAVMADSRPPKIWPPGSAVVGAVEKRTESMDSQFFQTWSFRIFRLEDGHVPVEPPIPVEIRGRSIIGQLAKGDVVKIPPGQPGRTRIVKTLHNLTTQSVVEAKGRPFRRTRTLRRTVGLFWTIIGGILALALLLAIAAGVYLMLGGDLNLPT